MTSTAPTGTSFCSGRLIDAEGFGMSVAGSRVPGTAHVDAPTSVSVTRGGGQVKLTTTGQPDRSRNGTRLRARTPVLSGSVGGMLDKCGSVPRAIPRTVTRRASAASAARPSRCVARAAARSPRPGTGTASAAARRSGSGAFPPHRPRRRRPLPQPPPRLRSAGCAQSCSSTWWGSPRCLSPGTQKRCVRILSRYFQVARRLITRYGGVVEKFIGDAVMAVWGHRDPGD